MISRFSHLSPFLQLSAEVCQSFLVGCDELVDKSLQGAISSLEELEAKAQQLGDVSAAKIVRQCQTWLILLCLKKFRIKNVFNRTYLMNIMKKYENYSKNILLTDWLWHFML